MLDPYDENVTGNDQLAVVSHDPYIPYKPGTISWLDEDEQLCFPVIGPIHEYQHWITQTTHTPTLFHLGSYLAQLCQRYASLGMRVEVGGRLKRPRLYALLVAPSGVGKSTPINRATQFFNDHCIRVGNVVVPQSYPITADSTAAGISRLLQESTTAFGDNEVGLFVCEEAERIFSRSRQHPVDALFCGLYDGNFTQHVTAKNLIEAKKGEDQVTKLSAPIVSLLFAMPEASFLGDGMEKASDTGLIPRFMVFEGRIRKPKASEVAFPEGYNSASRALDEAITWFLQKRDALAVGMKPWEDDPEDGLIRVKLSQAAFDVYKERVADKDMALYERIKEISDAERNFRAYRLRTYDQAYTIAALYALTRKSLIVSAADMHRALNLADMSIRSMEGMIKILGKDDMGLAKELIRYRLGTLNKPWQTERTLLTCFVHKYPDASVDVFAKALRELLLTGEVTRKDPPAPAEKKRGRPPVSQFALTSRLPPEDADPPSELPP